MDLETLVDRLRRKDPRALARALTLVENRSPEARELLQRVFTDGGRAAMVGITGPPGVGKSTLADALAGVARAAGKDVAILAIDPTSPLSGGAVLGDRARMDAGAKDSSIFIRSMATRGHVGGLAGAAFEALMLLQAAGKDLILVETVGSGQDEVEVAAAVDVTVLVLAPGLGDEVQAAKAGIVEVADVFVVNKADREGSEGLASDLRFVASGRSVILTTATTGEGVDALFSELSRRNVASHPDRDRRFMEAWLWNVLQSMLRGRISETLWQDVLQALLARKITPYEAAERILKELA